jgi:Spy/CpxP family protein refolding chaperone
MKTTKCKRRLSLLALVLGLTVTLPSFGQESGTNNNQARPTDGQQPPANQDPVEGLQLTGEQRAAIRAVRLANRDEQMAVNQRLRRAQIALEDALDADYPNEALVEQRAREVGEAQVAAVRMRSLREVRIRRILTPEQQAKLRELRLQAREVESRRQQRRQNPLNEGRRPRNPVNQGNSVAPRREFPRKN